MKQATLLVALIAVSVTQKVCARDGYRITLKMADCKNDTVYLAHYYGRGRPTIYNSDSAVFDNSGTAVFDSKNPEFAGGIYIVLLKDKGQTNFELLLNKGDEMTITARRSKLPDGIQFKNSPENERFAEYIDFLKGYAKEQKGFEEELKDARTPADSAVVRKKATASARKRTAYMRGYAAKYPGTLLAKIFNAIEVPEVPEGTHYMEDGKTKDSTFAYRYYKSHYWDGWDFRDDRLIFTPLYDAKLEEYISKLTLPWPDSVKKECDVLLGKVRGTEDMLHYTLWWLTHYAENSKVMGMDEVFVHLVENYYMKGDTFWLTADELDKIIKRGQAIAPNVIGNLAPEVRLPNVMTGKEERVHDYKAEYTLLIFYSPTCGHCQHELPLIDSVYEATLKDKGVRVFTVATEGDQKSISDFLIKLKVDKKWLNTWDPEHTSDYHSKYDIYSTPTLYLLDDKKIIRGKRLDHSNIGGLVEMLEKKRLSKM